MSVVPEIQGLSIVLKGLFNPSIFHPTWFLSQQLIREQEHITALESAFIIPDAATFNTEWFSIQVTRDSISLSTVQDPYFEKLKDLAVGIIQLLPHTPVAMLGINNEAHFKLSNIEQWHNFGHKLAPKDGIWTGILPNPGLLNLIIEGKPRPDNYNGYVRVKIQPSTHTQIPHGVFIQSNDHYEFESAPDKRDGNELLKKVLLGNWEQNQNNWKELYTHLISLA